MNKYKYLILVPEKLSGISLLLGGLRKKGASLTLMEGVCQFLANH